MWRCRGGWLGCWPLGACSDGAKGLFDGEVAFAGAHLARYAIAQDDLEAAPLVVLIGRGRLKGEKVAVQEVLGNVVEYGADSAGIVNGKR